MSPSVRGHFVWHELITPDPEAAKPFYRKVVGWTTAPFNEGYSIFNTGKNPDAGLMATPPELKDAGVPPHWVCYIGTDDIEATVRQAAALGGQVMKEITTLPTVGKFAVLKDPQGAVFIAYTPETPGVPSYPAAVGGFSWNELATTDWPAAYAFYSALFGWEKGTGMDMGPMGIYQILELGGVQIGAMFNKPPEIPVPNWLPYARVKNVATAAAAVKAAGGQVINGPMDVPGGAIVQLLDPQGAVFAVHAMAEAAPATAAAPKPAKKAAKPAAKKASRPSAKKATKKAGKKSKKPAKKPAKKATKRAVKKPARKR
jgi:predicted enzyme related to lactoylglutathione lyase